ncbi:MAG: hypothetical protein RLY86_1385 [Pseudomonadota bacterium]|jgi:transcriptional regulator with XRE-family HTH domain
MAKEDGAGRGDGARLRDLRTRAGLSLAAAAAAGGMSKGELSKLETGVRPLRADHVVRLARVFGLPAADLLTPDSPYRALLADVATAGPALIPLYDGRDLARSGGEARPVGTVAPFDGIRGVAGAYAVTITDLSNAPALTPGVILHVDPGRVPTVGDLVVNRIHWSPLAFYLRQDDDGHLYGLTLSRRRVDLDLDDLDRLHKVAGIAYVG